MVPILYPHESPRRGGQFATQQICRAAVAIKQGRQKELLLGDLAAVRDWTDARDVACADEHWQRAGQRVGCPDLQTTGQR